MNINTTLPHELLLAIASKYNNLKKFYNYFLELLLHLVIKLLITEK